MYAGSSLFSSNFILQALFSVMFSIILDLILLLLSGHDKHLVMTI